MQVPVMPDCSGGRDDNYCAPAVSEKWGQGDLVSPVADRDSRDQKKRGRRVVRMAAVGNKTAECVEGRVGSVKKTLALLLCPLRLNLVVLTIERGRFNQDRF